MKTVRHSTFETNSSACHVLTLIKKEELQKMFEKQFDWVIHFPDTGEYQTSDKYEIMTIEDAWKLYESHVDEYNERYAHIDFHVDHFNNQYSFRVALERGEISQDELFGKFLTYGQLMCYIPPTSDGNVDITWWNYD